MLPFFGALFQAGNNEPCLLIYYFLISYTLRFNFILFILYLCYTCETISMLIWRHLNVYSSLIFSRG